MPSAPSAVSTASPLLFSCGACGNALEAPVSCAGVEAPCPLCGAPVRAPLPPPDPTELVLDASFWDDPAPEAPPRRLPAASGGAAPKDFSGPPSAFPSLPDSWFPPPAPPPPPPHSAPVPVTPEAPSAPAEAPAPLRFPSRTRRETEPPSQAPPAAPSADAVPPPRATELTPPAAESDEAEFEEVPDTDPVRVRARRKARRRLRMFDAGLLLFFFGVAAMAGAAIVFKEGKDQSRPAVHPPTLTAAHFELMRDVEERRRQSLEDARQTIQLLLTAPDAAAAAQVMLPGPDQSRGLPFPVFPGKEPRDFEFISGERLPGTERFLSLFELAGTPPVMVMVEETSAGSRLHGGALDQQLNRRLETLLATPGEGEGVFYLRVRPTPGPQLADFDKKRPDLTGWVKVDAESAFPMEGPAAFIACLAPGSPTLDVLERRLHDPGFRPAVARLVWRRHRESGPFLELVEFVPNSWSRH